MERRRGTVRDLRRDNRSVLLWSLYFDQPLSRQDLSQATGLSPASVSNVTRELISDGVVVEAGALILDPIIREAGRRSFQPCFEATQIVAASLGPDAVPVGAALLARAAS